MNVCSVIVKFICVYICPFELIYHKDFKAMQISHLRVCTKATTEKSQPPAWAEKSGDAFSTPAMLLAW